MKDSILKGTGNSRFLKSAVPAGTSWADALAMLQAGTFPIDFNGIDTEGFQQVGTPLNKANLLKDVNALTLGLTGDVTPNDMFNVLAHTGDLHVWRKTARDASVSAPGYNLGDIKSLTNICQAPSGYQGYFGVKAEYSDEVTVNNLGVISLVSPSEIELGFTGETAAFLPEGADNTLKNKFLKIVSVLAEQPNAKILDSYKDAVIHCESDFHCDGYGSSSPGYNIYFKNFRLVTPYPAGFSITYPVSTNPNAYQEGDDAKEAGYTLGEVVSGKFNLGIITQSDGWNYGVASSLTISENGNVAKLPLGLTTSNDLSSALQVKEIIGGKFIQLIGYNGRSDLPSTTPPFNSMPSSVVYIPSDVVVTIPYRDSTSTSDYGIYIDRYQPVTGYAAIPAGTTIEYLGKLGDKARVQVLSYIGTGTYGSSNPNSLTFDFIPKLFWISGPGYAYYTDMLVFYGDTNRSEGNSDYYFTFNNISWEGKKVSWYSESNTELQANIAGEKYTIRAIG